MGAGRAEGPRKWPLSPGSGLILNISIPYSLNCPHHHLGSWLSLPIPMFKPPPPLKNKTPKVEEVPQNVSPEGKSYTQVPCSLFLIE